MAGHHHRPRHQDGPRARLSVSRHSRRSRKSSRSTWRSPLPRTSFPSFPVGRSAVASSSGKGRIDFFHYDFYSQALSKIQRGHAKDLEDVREMIERSLVEPGKARELFAAIEEKLYRFPAIDPASFRRRVEGALLALAPAHRLEVLPQVGRGRKLREDERPLQVRSRSPSRPGAAARKTSRPPIDWCRR